MTNENHNQKREVGKRALVLMLGAGAVAVVRYIGVALHAEGSPVHGWLWDAVNGASGAGMAVLEAVGIWHAWEAWSTAQPSRNRSVLMALIVAMFASLVTMTTPYVFSASQQARTADTLAQIAPAALWVWSLAVAAAPLLVMASAGMADTLLRNAQEARGGAFDMAQVSQTLRDEWRADLARIERKQTLQAVQVTVNQAQPEPQEVAQPEITLRKPVAQVLEIAQPSASGKIDKAQLIAQLAERPDTPAAELAQLFGVSPQAVRATPEWKARQVLP